MVSNAFLLLLSVQSFIHLFLSSTDIVDIGFYFISLCIYLTLFVYSNRVLYGVVNIFKVIALLFFSLNNYLVVFLLCSMKSLNFSIVRKVLGDFAFDMLPAVSNFDLHYAIFMVSIISIAFIIFLLLFLKAVESKIVFYSEVFTDSSLFDDAYKYNRFSLIVIVFISVFTFLVRNDNGMMHSFSFILFAYVLSFFVVPITFLFINNLYKWYFYIVICICVSFLSLYVFHTKTVILNLFLIWLLSNIIFNKKPSFIVFCFLVLSVYLYPLLNSLRSYLFGDFVFSQVIEKAVDLNILDSFLYLLARVGTSIYSSYIFILNNVFFGFSNYDHVYDVNEIFRDKYFLSSDLLSVLDAVGVTPGIVGQLSLLDGFGFGATSLLCLVFVFYYLYFCVLSLKSSRPDSIINLCFVLLLIINNVVDGVTIQKMVFSGYAITLIAVINFTRKLFFSFIKATS